MKILHIWNTAGIASILSKYLVRKGIQSKVLERKQFDYLKFSEYYKDVTQSISNPVPIFRLRCIAQSASRDIIHVHSYMELIPALRKFYPKKKIIFHAHGSEMRLHYDYYNKYVIDIIDKCIISTNDLHVYDTNAVYLPNIVDTDLFHFRQPNGNGRAFTFSIHNMDMDKIKHYCTDTIPTYDELIRNKEYRDMPDVFHRYSKYVDVKIMRGDKTPLQAYSTTGLQALSCGLEVINYKLESIRGMPNEHTPEYVIPKLMEIYNSV